ncbi:MAG: hypothetical protein ABIR77_03325 [Sphingomicrobium sp.]
MKNIGRKQLAILTVSALAMVSAMAFAQSAPALDPFASSNGIYPSQTEYSGPVHTANLDYPKPAAEVAAQRYQATLPINKGTAPAYLRGLIASIRPTLSGLINDGVRWDARREGWYDMIWLGEGSRGSDGSIDPESGREAVGNTYTGQILPPRAFCNRRMGKGTFGMALAAAAPPIPTKCDPDPGLPQGPIPTTSVQNHAVMYYNAIAAEMLGRVWFNPYAPAINQIIFPEGSVVVKIEAVTSTEAEWPVVRNAATWQVYRPSVADALKPPAGGAKPQLLNVRPFQMSVAIKDRTASPTTGWVYAAFVYDAAAPGPTAWDRFVPVGAMWGNDPQLTSTPSGNNGSPDDLQQTWFNPFAPLFTHGARGWGGRLAGPMDVADRVNVLFTGGNNQSANLRQVGASSCLSCHSAAEFPWTRNLYPAPVRGFPRNGEPFMLYQPGSAEWARWFQNPSVPRGVSNATVPRGLDYDFALMFALGTQATATGQAGIGFRRFAVH